MTWNWRSVRVKWSDFSARTAQERPRPSTLSLVLPGLTLAAFSSTTKKSRTCRCISGPAAASATSRRNLREVADAAAGPRSEEHTSELQSQSNLVCRLLLEKKKKK